MNADWIDPFLPKMQCDPGCGVCCGPAPASQAEFDSVSAYARKNGIEPIKQGATCPWYQDGTCAVYEARPSVCRLFGHIPGMQCCKGYNVNIAPAAEKRVLLTCSARTRKQPMRLLHEVCYTFRELNQLIGDMFGVGAKRVLKPDDPREYHLAVILSSMGKNERPLLCVDPEAGEYKYSPGAQPGLYRDYAKAPSPDAGGGQLPTDDVAALHP